MNPYVLSGLQSVVLFVDGLKTGTTTKLSFATGNTTSSVRYLSIYCQYSTHKDIIRTSCWHVSTNLAANRYSDQHGFNFCRYSEMSCSNVPSDIYMHLPLQQPVILTNYCCSLVIHTYKLNFANETIS